ncbi:hypothetical protein ACJJTC_008479 [Scirpophaga incertulas]
MPPNPGHNDKVFRSDSSQLFNILTALLIMNKVRCQIEANRAPHSAVAVTQNYRAIAWSDAVNAPAEAPDNTLTSYFQASATRPPPGTIVKRPLYDPQLSPGSGEGRVKLVNYINERLTSIRGFSSLRFDVPFMINGVGGINNMSIY